MNTKNEYKINIYDWPVRFFHWVFALLFVSAFFIAKTFEDDSAQYPYHMIIGFTIAFAVILRGLWGIFGSKFARFNSFELSPSDLIKYFKSIIKSSGQKFLGHNPASSWAAILMMICALGLAMSGYFMVHGYKEELEDFHELFANGFLFLAIAHVIGIVVHTIKHKDPIGLSMITGKKNSADSHAGIQNNYLAAGVLFLLLIGAFGANLFRHYDGATKTLTIFKTTHKLGKVEAED